mmetsp:Transcript_23492/g.35669  ORF Transcript_23492/g.35669 Transcript_23492/m.35669 type:complete len:163 (-) Transcript_23492:433-921(-)
MGYETVVPADWYLAAQRIEGVHLWVPAPAAAGTAVELLAKSIQIRPNSHHIWLAPSIWTSTWRKTLGKAMDFTMELPFDSKLWSRDSDYEKLTLAISFPILSRYPWKIKLSGLHQQVKDNLHRVQEPSLAHFGHCLRKLWVESFRDKNMPPGMACQMLSHER